MRQIENKRTKNLREEVKGTTVTIDYRVSGETASTEAGEVETVTSVFGSIRKADDVLGFVSYEKAGDRLIVTFEPFGDSTAKEKKAVLAAVASNIDEILTQNSEQ